MGGGVTSVETMTVHLTASMAQFTLVMDQAQRAADRLTMVLLRQRLADLLRQLIASRSVG